MTVPGEDHLALLGHLEPAVHRAGGLGQHGPAGRAAAAAQRAAAAVEQGQPDVVLGGPPGQPLLRAEQPQVGADRAQLLGRVGVPEHGLQLPVARGQPLRHRLQGQHVVQDLGRVLQVRPALEQRDHVQLRRRGAVRHGQPGQLVDGGDVGGRGGEADHVAVAGLRPVPLLDLGDGRQRGQHLAGHGRPGRARVQLAQRPGVHGTVLADLQRGQVEAEALGLPDQVLQLAERLAAGPGVGQGLLEQPQVGEQLTGIAVGQAGLRRGLARPGGGLRRRGPQPGGPQSRGDEQAELAERLLRRARGQFGHEHRLDAPGGGQGDP